MSYSLQPYGLQRARLPCPLLSPRVCANSCPLGRWFYVTILSSRGFPHSSVGKEYANGTPLQYSCLENPMDGGAWWAVVHGVAKSRIWLSDFTFTFHFHALEKEMATHSSVLAWRIPGTGKPGGLPSMGSHRVGHDWSDLAAAAAACAEQTVNSRLACLGTSKAMVGAQDRWVGDWQKRWEQMLKGNKGV